MRLWTIKEIGELTGLSRWTLWRLRKSGKLKAIKVGGSPRVSHQHLVLWLGFDPLKDSSITIEKTVTKSGSTVHSITRIQAEQPSLFDR